METCGGCFARLTLRRPMRKRSSDSPPQSARLSSRLAAASALGNPSLRKRGRRISAEAATPVGIPCVYAATEKLPSTGNAEIEARGLPVCAEALEEEAEGDLRIFARILLSVHLAYGGAPADAEALRLNLRDGKFGEAAKVLAKPALQWQGRQLAEFPSRVRHLQTLLSRLEQRLFSAPKNIVGSKGLKNSTASSKSPRCSEPSPASSLAGLAETRECLGRLQVCLQEARLRTAEFGLSLREVARFEEALLESSAEAEAADDAPCSELERQLRRQRSLHCQVEALGDLAQKLLEALNAAPQPKILPAEASSPVSLSLDGDDEAFEGNPLAAADAADTPLEKAAYGEVDVECASAKGAVLLESFPSLAAAQPSPPLENRPPQDSRLSLLGATQRSLRGPQRRRKNPEENNGLAVAASRRRTRRAGAESEASGEENRRGENTSSFANSSARLSVAELSLAGSPPKTRGLQRRLAEARNDATEAVSSFTPPKTKEASDCEEDGLAGFGETLGRRRQSVTSSESLALEHLRHRIFDWKAAAVAVPSGEAERPLLPSAAASLSLLHSLDAALPVLLQMRGEKAEDKEEKEALGCLHQQKLETREALYDVLVASREALLAFRDFALEEWVSRNAESECGAPVE